MSRTIRKHPPFELRVSEEGKWELVIKEKDGIIVTLGEYEEEYTALRIWVYFLEAILEVEGKERKAVKDFFIEIVKERKTKA